MWTGLTGTRRSCKLHREVRLKPRTLLCNKQQAAVLTALPLCLGTRSEHHRTFTLNKLICLSLHRIEKLVGRVTMF